ncbi:MAG: NAD(P)-dependent oxidoreductase [Anaerolineae bacterium]|nr:NAD(P)-dependent oxidoreductase [Anaerolineae bacterium]
MSSRRKVLVTGASGHIGRVFAQHYGDRYALRLAYHTRPIVAPEHEVVQMNLADLDSVLAALDGVDAIVHMGADSSGHAPWDSVLRNNIVGTYNTYEAARIAGVSRVVYASSNHAAGYDIRDHSPIGPDAPIRPDSLYGVSKCFGESLGRYYHDAHGLAVICLRIGACHQLDDPAAERERLRRAVAQRRASFPYTTEQTLGIWISNRDMAQLIHKSLETVCTFGIFYGASENEPPVFDLSETKKVLGYEPQDRVNDFL